MPIIVRFRTSFYPVRSESFVFDGNFSEKMDTFGQYAKGISKNIFKNLQLC
jgi:hypothetical protein